MCSALPPSIDTLRVHLQCPVTLETLSEAVSLVPCAHKVQQAVAERIFGVVDSGWEVRVSDLCPVCRVPVVGYMADHVVRNIVTDLLPLTEDKLSASIPYPGKQAQFIYHKGDWNVLFEEEYGSLCRKIDFISSTKDSFLKSFCMLGYKNGSVAISMNFPPESTHMTAYLKQFDITPNDSEELYGFYISEDEEQLKTLFNIIAENNEIPASHSALIREIVDLGRCE